MSRDEIMKCILDNYPSDFDKREGSVLWDMIIPKALELQNLNPNITPQQVKEAVKGTDVIWHSYLASLPSYY